VDRGLGEVDQAARVVEVKVGEHHVPNVLDGVAEPPHLRERGLLAAGTQPDPAHEGAPQPLVGPVDAGRPGAGLHQHQLAAGLEQQAVADQFGAPQQPAPPVDQAPAARPHGAAVEVVDPHPLRSHSMLRSSQTGESR
jgi:hypothetical protein